MKRGGLIFYVAILGIVIGVLLSMLCFSVWRKYARLNAEYGEWRKLNLILEQVEQNYVDTIDVRKMTDAAVEAALSKLDPHSVYLPPVDLEKAETELAGNFEGIGIQFNVPNDTAIVLSVISGGPSERAGLLQGDRIIKVDDKVIAGVKTPQDTMVKYMKGPSGSKVNILVNRSGTSIPFEITRGKIPVNSIDAAFMVNDTTGYIKLSKFTRTTFKEFREATSDLLDKGMTKLIFDLRRNTGGYFDQAYLLSNEFLKRGDNVVYMEGLHRKREDLKADGSGRLKDIRLSVLIDEASASSSEIFAGAIQDNDRGVIIGRRSFGKGLVQEPVNFTDGSGIRLTVARFHTPSGRCIQKPYSDDYAYDIYERYAHGEMTEADSIKIDKSVEYHTVGGRVVYGGGGIIPDVFVPVDTTKATKFFLECDRKALTVRFASSVFDKYRNSLPKIDNYDRLLEWLDSVDLESGFLSYAAANGVTATDGEWEETAVYMMPQIRALIGRYSKLDDEAFYRLYMDIDDMLSVAVNDSGVVQL